MALAADTELRRRHPEAKLPPLRATEPEPRPDDRAAAEAWVERAVTGEAAATPTAEDRHAATVGEERTVTHA